MKVLSCDLVNMRKNAARLRKRTPRHTDGSSKALGRSSFLILNENSLRLSIWSLESKSDKNFAKLVLLDKVSSLSSLRTPSWGVVWGSKELF